MTISCGHSHPYIVSVAKKQIETLMHTTTIYLNPNISEYGKMLASKFPGNLSVVYFVNSGSEANDLALLMARAYTGNHDVISLRNAYHGGSGNSMGLTAHSSWKYNTPHGSGVHHALNPDRYRGFFGYDDSQASEKYASDIEDLISRATSGNIAAFIAESIQGVGGVTVYPEGYLKKAYEIVRKHGGLCIADEVQTGFGRTGEHFWGFEGEGVIPDIVTLAKGIGNGIPLAAVVTTPEIAKALTQRIHLNTFGGNPLSCAIGKAVLETIEKENLQQNALERGKELMDGLKKLQNKYPERIGDVRGKGLMLGVEIVKNNKTKEADKESTTEILEMAKDMGLLIGRGGYFGNVIRIKPVMCITSEDVDFALKVLDIAFSKTFN